MQKVCAGEAQFINIWFKLTVPWLSFLERACKKEREVRDETQSGRRIARQEAEHVRHEQQGDGGGGGGEEVPHQHALHAAELLGPRGRHLGAHLGEGPGVGVHLGHAAAAHLPPLARRVQETEATLGHRLQTVVQEHGHFPRVNGD